MAGVPSARNIISQPEWRPLHKEKGYAARVALLGDVHHCALTGRNPKVYTATRDIVAEEQLTREVRLAPKIELTFTPLEPVGSGVGRFSAATKKAARYRR